MYSNVIHIIQFERLMMASQLTAVRLPGELVERYDQLAKSTHRTRSFYLTQALSQSIDQLEYEYGILSDVEAYKRGELETVTVEEARRDLGLDD